MDCGFCTNVYVDPRCGTHGNQGLGLAHAVEDPASVAIVVCAEVVKHFSGTDQEILKAALTTLRGHGNPKVIVSHIREFRDALK